MCFQMSTVADVWRMDWGGPKLKKEGTILEVELASLLIVWTSSMKKREKSGMILGFWLEKKVHIGGIYSYVGD